MFDFVEKKEFFYFFAILSVIVTISFTYLSMGNMSALIQLILLVSLLIAMMIFYNYNHKELMKVLLDGLLPLLYALTAVSAEAFINTQRMNKTK